MSRRLTPADYRDLEDERCRYVSDGRHDLLIYADGPYATGQVTCENPGCPVDVIHPSFSGRPYYAPRTNTPQAPRPKSQAARGAGKVRLWPWLASAAGAAFIYARARGWAE